jgi:predicted AlkP superfamily phosphohydrolase/phosphomutase
MSPKPVLAVALDCGDPQLIERWMSEGILPNLQELVYAGSYGRLESTAEILGGSPWPTFYTGKTPGDHGLYHYMQWCPEQMEHITVTPDWLPARPFWRELANMGYRVIAIDIPMVYPPATFNGMEVYGWATGDTLTTKEVPFLFPSSLGDLIHKKLGIDPLPFGDRMWGIQNADGLLQLRDRLVESTDNITNLAEKLMKHEKWDLFMVCLGAPHPGGHKFWDASGLWNSSEIDEFNQALQDIYVACDAAVGRLVNGVDGEVTKLVFSLHGMGPNTDRSSMLPKMLDKILSNKTKGSHLFRNAKEHVPGVARVNVSKNPLSGSLYKIYQFISQKLNEGNHNLAPVFCLRTDQNGYIRINLKGREASGIVNPGQDYDNICNKIIEGLKTFVDYDTGEPVVKRIIITEQLYEKGDKMKHLPDIIVQWTNNPSANQKAVVSNRYGTIPWLTPGRNPSGRSGNHRSEGFLLAIGDHIQPDSKRDGAHILDLAPTICALLEAPLPWDMCGKIIPEIKP